MSPAPQQSYTAWFGDRRTMAVTLDLGQELGRGGTSTVYRAYNRNQGQDWAAKLYHEGKANAANYEKLAYLTQSPVAIREPNRAALPVAILTDQQNHPAGMLMPLIPPEQYTELTKHYNIAASRRERDDPEWERHRWRIAANLCQGVADVHAAGHACGDLNERNVLADSTGAVVLLDTDGWQVNDPATGRQWNCIYARHEYTPPEVGHLLGQQCTDHRCPQRADGPHTTVQGCMPRRADHDNFALAILVFKLLMVGEDPFGFKAGAHGQEPTRKQMIENGLFRYGPQHWECCGPRTAAAGQTWEKLPTAIRELMAQSLTANTLGPVP